MRFTHKYSPASMVVPLFRAVHGSVEVTWFGFSIQGSRRRVKYQWLKQPQESGVSWQYEKTRRNDMDILW
jgi:hypothetical protein